MVVTTDVPIFGAREWDQRNYRAPMKLSLPSVLDVLALEAEARRTFKFDVSVPERAFSAATGNFRAALEDARTTTLGDFKLTLELPSAEAAA